MLVLILRWTHQYVNTIGRSVPASTYGKHKIKRVDRFLENGRGDPAVIR